MANETADRFRVLLSCPDRRGIVAEVSRLLAEQGANVTAAAQFTDPASHQFFVRYEVETDSGSVTSTLSTPRRSMLRFPNERTPGTSESRSFF